MRPQKIQKSYFACFQLYLLSPIILLPLWKLRKHVALVFSACAVIAFCSVAYIFTMYWLNRYRVSILSSINHLRYVDIYYMTTTRIAPWMVGIAIGFILHLCKDKEAKISKHFALIGWTFFTTSMSAIVLGQLPLVQENSVDNPWFADAIYDSFKGVTWSLAVGWIIIACHFSCGGFINRFLSHPAWLPISRISFSIYLVHFPIQMWQIMSLESAQSFSNSEMLYMFFRDFFISLIVALFWSLLFELPTVKLLKKLKT